MPGRILSHSEDTCAERSHEQGENTREEASCATAESARVSASVTVRVRVRGEKTLLRIVVMENSGSD